MGVSEVIDDAQFFQQFPDRQARIRLPGKQPHRDQQRAVRYLDGAPLRTDLSCTLFLCDPDDYEGGELVGIARALSDFAIETKILDMIIAPEYQRQGIGQKMMRKIVIIKHNYYNFLIMLADYHWDVHLSSTILQ